MAHPLSDDDMLCLGQQYLRMADRDEATARDQAALRDFVPALLHRLREKADEAAGAGGEAVLDLRFCGAELVDGDEEQIELALPRPD